MYVHINIVLINGKILMFLFPYISVNYAHICIATHNIDNNIPKAGNGFGIMSI